MEQTIINALESIHEFLTGNVAFWGITSVALMMIGLYAEWRNRKIWH